MTPEETPPDRKLLFEKAMALDPVERSAFLDEACAGDADLREELGSLCAHTSETFLVQPAAELLDAGQQPQVDQRTRPGARIGKYTVHDVLGEGGMGVVVRALQTEPVQREVAIKVVKPGMDSTSVLARFRNESEILGRLEHPAIARLFDAGSTEDSRPYFVMELVRGRPIDNYCNERRLSVRERIELMIAVCRAVQRAHMRGVIHRDLKPSNVLIVEHEGVPTPKIIDFGIAKALQGSQIGSSLVTRIGDPVGTPAYMCPEQAEASLDIDIRADVYSLGILTYFLLTSRFPYEGPEGKPRGCRRIEGEVHDTPARPSDRVRDTESRADRTIGPLDASREVRRCLRNELDWAILCAVDPDRSRRYASVSDFADDLQRFLDGRALESGPPSKSYRARKFLHRHRGPAAICSTTLLGLIGLAIGFYLAFDAEVAARNREVAAKQIEVDARESLSRQYQRSQGVKGFLADLLVGIDPEYARGQDTTLLRELLDDAAARLEQGFEGDPGSTAELQGVIGSVYSSIGQFRKARDLLASAVATIESYDERDQDLYALELGNLAIAHLELGELEEAERVARKNYDLAVQLSGENSVRALKKLGIVARVLGARGRVEEANEIYLRRKVAFEQTEDPDDPWVISAIHDLALFHFNRGEIDEAINAAREALDRATRSRGADSPTTINYQNSLGFLLRESGDSANAVGVLEEALGNRQDVFGPDHPQTLETQSILARALIDVGDADRAEELADDALTRATEALGRDHWVLGVHRYRRGLARVQGGRVESGLADMAVGLSWLEARLGSDHPRVARLRAEYESKR